MCDEAAKEVRDALLQHADMAQAAHQVLSELMPMKPRTSRAGFFKTLPELLKEPNKEQTWQKEWTV